MLRYNDEVPDDVVKSKMLNWIYRECDRGVGVRTTEVESIYKNSMLGRQKNYNSDDREWYDYPSPKHGELTRLITELAAEGKIEFWTEDRPNGRSDYCWMTRPNWTPYSRNPMKKLDQPFDLWG